MDTTAALISIERLEKRTHKLVALTPREAVRTGLPIIRRMTNGETQQPMFFYVDRLQYIEYLKQQHNLHKKRSNFMRMLRGSYD